MKKILILIPPRHRGRWVSREYKDGYYDLPHPPYLMLSTAAVLKQRFPESVLTFLDAQCEALDFRSVEERVAALQPDVIICSLGTISIREDARYLEFRFPTIGVMQAYLNKPEGVKKYNLKAQYYTDREVELTVAEAVEEIINTGSIENTRGLYLKRGDEISFTGERETDNLSHLPRPLFEISDPRQYLRIQQAESGTGFMFLYTARGCPFICSFCAPPGPSYRKVLYKNADQVIEEISFLQECYGISTFYFMDDEFASDIARAKEICRKIIARKLGISFVIYNNVKLVDEELMILLKRAGCTLIRYGVETADKSIQIATHKNLSREQIIRAFQLSSRNGILTDAFFLIGFPGETDKTLKENLRLIRDMQPDRITPGILFPKPYSKMYDEFKASGSLLTEDWSELYPDKLSYRHEYYHSSEDIVKAMHALSRTADRFISFREIFVNRTGKNLYSRLGRFLMTFDRVRSLIKKHQWLHYMLRKPYQPSSKLRI
ncbi:MAG: radical SAM protein [Nitrospirae bacterium]|nr:radical SAM protein [Nitrospirota bacterium]